jgi:hypothetical protein
MMPSLAESAAMANNDRGKDYNASFVGWPPVRWDIGISMRSSIVLRFHIEGPLHEHGNEFVGTTAPAGMSPAEARQLAANLIELAEVIETRDAPDTALNEAIERSRPIA